VPGPPVSKVRAVETARRAVGADAAELVRLRAVMLAGLTGRDPAGEEWRRNAAVVLRTRLAEPEPRLVAFVVDRPGASTGEPAGLAACAVGTVEDRLPGPEDPTGRTGYVFNVATDPDCRRRGLSRLCTAALLDWFRAQRVGRVDLRASPDGESLYRELGFVRSPAPAMRLQIPAPDA